jgi:hypothetical protein
MKSFMWKMTFELQPSIDKVLTKYTGLNKIKQVFFFFKLQTF